MYSEWEWHVMIKKGDLISLKAMLDNADKNAVTELKFKNETLLATAIKCGFVNIVNLLLIHGADPNTKSAENGRHEPPLVTATRWKNLEIVKLLIQHGANIGQEGFYGHDAIFQAVVDNAFAILKHFLQISNSQPSEHDARNCPIRIALKYSPKFVCKFKSLLLFLQYGYSCACVQKEYTTGISTGCYSEVWTFQLPVEKSLVFNMPLTLFNLARSKIRYVILMKKCNLFKNIYQLSLPNKLLQALLFQDFDVNTILVKSSLHTIDIAVY